MLSMGSTFERCALLDTESAGRKGIWSTLPQDCRKGHCSTLPQGHRKGHLVHPTTGSQEWAFVHTTTGSQKGVSVYFTTGSFALSSGSLGQILSTHHIWVFGHLWKTTHLMPAGSHSWPPSLLPLVHFLASNPFFFFAEEFESIEQAYELRTWPTSSPGRVNFRRILEKTILNADRNWM